MALIFKVSRDLQLSCAIGCSCMVTLAAWQRGNVFFILGNLVSNWKFSLWSKGRIAVRGQYLCHWEPRVEYERRDTICFLYYKAFLFFLCIWDLLCIEKGNLNGESLKIMHIFFQHFILTQSINTHLQFFRGESRPFACCFSDWGSRWSFLYNHTQSCTFKVKQKLKNTCKAISLQSPSVFMLTTASTCPLPVFCGFPSLNLSSIQLHFLINSNSLF